MIKTLRWYVVRTKGRRLGINDDEGDRVATRMQEDFAKLHPEGLDGNRVIFKWEIGTAMVCLYPYGRPAQSHYSLGLQPSLHEGHPERVTYDASRDTNATAAGDPAQGGCLKLPWHELK